MRGLKIFERKAKGYNGGMPWLLLLAVIPGAYGFGMETRAAYACGSPPAIIRVTNLNDSGTGSLRAALSQSGPRVVIFETSGTITLNTDLEVQQPCLTIAGQTAPAPGITLRDSGLSIHTHDVLIQHIRIRPGDRIRPSDCYNGQCGVRVPQTYGHDALLLYKNNSTAQVYNVVVDHVSISWAAGKNANVITYSPGVTFWRCLISEALYRASNVIVGQGEPSSLGMLIASDVTGVTVAQSLFAHNADRNPEFHEGNVVQFVNNVVYGWGKDLTWYPWASQVAAYGANPIRVDIIGNLYIAGMPPYPFTPIYAAGVWVAHGPSQLYVDRNLIDQGRHPVTEYVEHNDVFIRVKTPSVPQPAISVVDPSTIEGFVLQHAGARPLDRDPVDARIVNQVKGRSGTVVSSQTQVGGWPALAVNTRTLTTPTMPHMVMPSGYTVLEEWLHGYAAVVEPGRKLDAPTLFTLK